MKELSKSELNKLLDIVFSYKPNISQTQSLLSLNENFGLNCHGAITPIVKETATQILKSNGISPKKTKKETLNALNVKRNETPLANEKAFTRPPREDYINYRLINIEDNSQSTPSEQFHGATYQFILSLDVDIYVIIENFIAFTDVIARQIPIPSNAKRVLLLYRGDNKTSPKAISRLIEQSTVPCDFWGDFDVEGLLIASRIPNLKHIIVPTEQGAYTQKDKFSESVYLRQSSSRQQAISKMKSPNIIKQMTFLTSNSIAIMQEKMIQHDIPLQRIAVD